VWIIEGIEGRGGQREERRGEESLEVDENNACIGSGDRYRGERI